MNECISCGNPHIENREKMLCAKCNRLERKFATAKIPDDPKPIAKQSEDMKRIMPIYLRNKKRFLRGKKCAVMPHLDAVDVHHSCGRGIDSYYDEWAQERGICLLLDERFWVPVSREGHTEIEMRPNWAKQMGFSEDRLVPMKMRNEE